MISLFPVPSSIALVSAAMVIRAKNPVHSVLSSIPVSRNTPGLPLTLGFDSSAMIFPVVYIGAIAVLSSFVAMMLNIKIAEIHENVLRYLPVGGIIGPISLPEVSVTLDNDYIPLPTSLGTTPPRYTVYAGRIQSWTNSETLGDSLHTNYFLFFLVSGLIPLVAMIGATVPTMHKTTRVKRQDVFQQNAIDSQKTIEGWRFSTGSRKWAPGRGRGGSA
uniref:NADH-ubiquinone oxidoreductase chain 6 n=1 Tax=Ophioglossum californicum TaxID=1267209 RepID=A0A1B3TRH8_9MONI|nr:NADH dehydrogenase subunit 6 [Ophioglossum californicum]YP_010439861.1 NADH dehydrogenase subunit 6 [Ophioglossum vulgatum]AOH05913.1 NADH dehydrogenase subunit 6 [Ophioglossum californicum]UTD44907.1 NADH dehydrogenase subunit 6 [Ophioglossum vulgatum]